MHYVCCAILTNFNITVDKIYFWDKFRGLADKEVNTHLHKDGRIYNR